MEQRRFTKQVQQERVSISQIAVRFHEYGWIPTQPSLDLGEDFFIHIYNNGCATGVFFHVQAKSVTNIHKRKKGNVLPYSFKPKDFKHWEKFSSPVVLIIWDTKSNEGRWELVSKVISELDKSHPGWRENRKSVTVHIPWKNDFTHESLNLLKKEIGQYFYPQISGGKELKLKFSLEFPNTIDGQRALEAFERYIKEGEPVSLIGRTIKEIHFSDWWEEWFGAFYSDPLELHLGGVYSPKKLIANIDAVSSKGETASIPNIEFQLVQFGTELAKITNDHQESPFKFYFGIRNSNVLDDEFSLAVHGSGRNLAETCNILRFSQVIADGCKLHITFHKFANEPLIIDIKPHAYIAPDPRLVKIVNKLVFIQTKTGIILNIPDQGFSIQDINSINELYQILEHGVTITTKVTATFKIKVEVLRKMLDFQRPSKPIHLRQISDDSYVEVFGKSVNTGPITRDIMGFIELPVKKFEEEILKLNSDKIISVKLINATVTEFFSKWSKNQFFDRCYYNR